MCQGGVEERRATADPGTALTRRGDVAYPRPGERPEHPLGSRWELHPGPGTSRTLSLAWRHHPQGVRVRLGQRGRRPWPGKPGGSELEARARSSALYRAHKPLQVWSACSPFIPQGSEKDKGPIKKSNKKNISLTPKRTLFNEVENSSTQIAFSTTL